MSADLRAIRWKAVVSALEIHEQFRSRVSAYQHPLAGRPIVWHVVRALLDTTPQPDAVVVLHRAGTAVSIGPEQPLVRYVEVPAGEEARALRAAVTSPGLTVLVDGAAALITASTVARLLRAGEAGVASLTTPGGDHEPHVAVAGEGPALASASDPRHPHGAARVVPNEVAETLRVVDRRSLSDASVAIRDRLVRRHEAAGVTFLLPATSWIDVDVRIGTDTMIYPGAVIEGATDVGSECVIGPHSRIVESTIGRGSELKGWNYVARVSVRNHAVLEPYERRGLD
jgi:bifunctional N-acetylglucosamine-1-phosphate-uridyltransferase/glucosamine-1-phosphate-acetyltransferase GlmU-like protein